MLEFLSNRCNLHAIEMRQYACAVMSSALRLLEKAREKCVRCVHVYRVTVDCESTWEVRALRTRLSPNGRLWKHVRSAAVRHEECVLMEVKIGRIRTYYLLIILPFSPHVFSRVLRTRNCNTYRLPDCTFTYRLPDFFSGCVTTMLFNYCKWIFLMLIQ